MRQRQPTRMLGKHPMVCRFCGAEFLSKRQGGTVCYADVCQRQKEAERQRQQYERKLLAQAKGETDE